ncbi:MAG TPA: hypothetical protein PLR74_08460, partial [Agriterribacter sp.]|nr:hypothetical protein [Agriterribacter sp.]
MPIFTNQFPSLKTTRKILKIACLSLLFLVVMTAIVVNSAPVQNWLVKAVTHRLSKDLNTKVTIRHVHFALFNKMNLQGVYIEDRQKDTLLYAGKIMVHITDWFFLKDRADLKYIGLEDATIHLHREDAEWNYQFLADYFSSPPAAQNKKQITLSLKEIALKNIHISHRDEWRGQDMELGLQQLNLKADEINFTKKLVNIAALELDEPVFTIYDYAGRRPQLPTPPAGNIADTVATVFNTGG